MISLGTNSYVGLNDTVGTYDTAKYLVSILKPLRDEAKYSLKDTFDLCSRLKKANEEDEYEYTYELVPREITESVEHFNGLEKHQLKKLKRLH